MSIFENSSLALWYLVSGMWRNRFIGLSWEGFLSEVHMLANRLAFISDRFGL